MPDGFKIADAYVEVVADINRESVRAGATAAGAEAGSSFEGGTRTYLRDAQGRFTSEIGDALGGSRRRTDDEGRKSGKGFLDNFGTAFGGGFMNAITLGFRGGSISSAFAANPEVAAVGVGLGAAVVAAALPAIGAGITAGAGLISSAGGLFAGALLTLKASPEVRSAASELGKSIMGVDTTPLEENFTKAQAALTAAQASGSKARIASAQAEYDSAKKALDDAVSYNQSHMTLLGMASKAFSGPMTDAMDKLSKAWTQIAPSVGQIFDTLAPEIGPLTDGFVGLVQNALPGFLDFLKSSQPMVQTLAEHMPEIGKALSVFFDALSKGGPGATKFLGDILTFLEGQIVMWGYLIGWLSQAYGAVHDFFAAIPGWLSDAGKWFDDTWHKIEDFFSGLWDKATNLASSFGDTLQGWVDSVGSKVDAVVSWFEALPDRIITWVESMPGRIEDLTVRWFDGWTYLIGYGIGSVVDFFVKLPGRAADAVSSLWTSVSTWFTQTRQHMADEAAGAVADAEKWLKGLPGRASNAVSSLWGSVSHWFSTTRSNVSNEISGAVSDAINWLSGLPGRAYNAVAGLGNSVRNAVSGASSWLYNAGRDVLSGLVNGIDSLLSWAVDAAWRAAKNIARGFMDALGIHSPSRLMRDEVGAQLLPGAVQGVQDTVPETQRALAGLAQDAVAPLSAGMAAPTGAAAGGGRGLTIENLHLQGVWDFTNPAAIRAMIANLYEALAAYEKEYA